MERFWRETIWYGTQCMNTTPLLGPSIFETSMMDSTRIPIRELQASIFVIFLIVLASDRSSGAGYWMLNHPDPTIPVVVVTVYMIID